MAERPDIEVLLGEFYSEASRPVENHFRHVVNNKATLASTSWALGRKEEALRVYESISLYVDTLRRLPGFREREFTSPVPPECDFFDEELYHDIGLYVERAYEEFGS